MAGLYLIAQLQHCPEFDGQSSAVADAGDGGGLLDVQDAGAPSFDLGRLASFDAEASAVAVVAPVPELLDQVLTVAFDGVHNHDAAW